MPSAAKHMARQQRLFQKERDKIMAKFREVCREFATRLDEWRDMAQAAGQKSEEAKDAAREALGYGVDNLPLFKQCQAQIGLPEAFGHMLQHLSTYSFKANQTPPVDLSGWWAQWSMWTLPGGESGSHGDSFADALRSWADGKIEVVV